MITADDDYEDTAIKLSVVLHRHGRDGAVESVRTLIEDAGEPSTAIGVAVGSLIRNSIDPHEAEGLLEWLRGESDTLWEEADEWARYARQWDEAHAAKDGDSD